LTFSKTKGVLKALTSDKILSADEVEEEEEEEGGGEGLS